MKADDSFELKPTKVGETDSAIHYLVGTIPVVTFWSDPVWDPLRNDPRFQKLIADGEAVQARDLVKP
jgi:hypothetical protein